MTWLRRTVYYFSKPYRRNQSRTVRYAFPVVLGALVLLSAATITSLETTTIEVEPSANNVRAGDVLNLDVYVSASEPVNAVDIELSIPSSQLKVTGIDTGESVITLWTDEPYEEDGVVYLRGGTFRRGFLGKHLIATVNAKAVNTGLAYVNVSESLLLAGDGTGSEVTSSPTDANAVKLYIANEQGQLVGLTDSAGTFEGSVEIRIVTDIDGDGDVSINDLSRFMAAWHSKSVIYDFSGDGKMTFRDFAIILADSFFK